MYQGGSRRNNWNVRFGSKADMCSVIRDVRFGPKADNAAAEVEQPKPKRLIRGLLHSAKHKRANNCDSDCGNACQNEGSHNPPPSIFHNSGAVQLQPLSEAPYVDRFDQLREQAITQQNPCEPNEIRWRQWHHSQMRTHR
jgi:hypothetical protein